MGKIMHEKIFTTNEKVNFGIFACTNCGYKICVKNGQILPLCPTCNNYEFTKEKG